MGGRKSSEEKRSTLKKKGKGKEHSTGGGKKGGRGKETGTRISCFVGERERKKDVSPQ